MNELKLSLGLYDDPAEQKQDRYEVDLYTSNLAIFGSAMTGKTSLLKWIILNIHYLMQDIEDEEIYILDFSNNLSDFRKLPFVLGYFNSFNEENIRRVLKVIEDKYLQNIKALPGKNFLQRENGCGAKHITFILDGIHVLYADDRYTKYQERILSLARDGLSKGVSVIFTTTDSNNGLAKLLNSFDHKIAFSINPDSYSNIFFGKVDIPMNMEGRGVANKGNKVYEFQAFLPYDITDPEKNDDSVINDMIERLISIESLGERSINELLDRKLESIPDTLNEDNWNVYVKNQKNWLITKGYPIGKSGHLVAGLDYYLCKPIDIDLLDAKCIAIYGKKNSGKTNLLKLILRGLLLAQQENMDIRVVYWDDNKNALKDNYLGIGAFLSLFGDTCEVKSENELLSYLLENRYCEMEKLPPKYRKFAKMFALPVVDAPLSPSEVRIPQDAGDESCFSDEKTEIDKTDVEEFHAFTFDSFSVQESENEETVGSALTDEDIPFDSFVNSIVSDIQDLEVELKDTKSEAEDDNSGEVVTLFDEKKVHGGIEGVPNEENKDNTFGVLSNSVEKDIRGLEFEINDEVSKAESENNDDIVSLFDEEKDFENVEKKSDKEVVLGENVTEFDVEINSNEISDSIELQEISVNRDESIGIEEKIDAKDALENLVTYNFQELEVIDDLEDTLKDESSFEELLASVESNDKALEVEFNDIESKVKDESGDEIVSLFDEEVLEEIESVSNEKSNFEYTRNEFDKEIALDKKGTAFGINTNFNEVFDSNELQMISVNSYDSVEIEDETIEADALVDEETICFKDYDDDEAFEDNLEDDDSFEALLNSAESDIRDIKDEFSDIESKTEDVEEKKFEEYGNIDEVLFDDEKDFEQIADIPVEDDVFEDTSTIFDDESDSEKDSILSEEEMTESTESEEGNESGSINKAQVYNNNPFTVFIIQNKSFFLKATDSESHIITRLANYLNECENVLFVFSDAQPIRDSEVRNYFNNSVRYGFLFDDILKYLSGKGSNSLFNGYDEDELKENFGRNEKGDAFFYDVLYENIQKIKVILDDGRFL